MLLPPSVPASPSPPSLCSQEASPIFCLIAAVSWQKATIFALLLSENKLQIIYSFTHTHTRTSSCTHTLSVRCKVGNRNWLSFFFRLLVLHQAQARLHQNGRGKQHKDRSQPNWVLPNTGSASCSACPACQPCLSGPKVILTKIPSVGIICISCGSHSGSAFSPSLSLFLSLSHSTPLSASTSPFICCFNLIFNLLSTRFECLCDRDSNHLRRHSSMLIATRVSICLPFVYLSPGSGQSQSQQFLLRSCRPNIFIKVFRLIRHKKAAENPRGGKGGRGVSEYIQQAVYYLRQTACRPTLSKNLISFAFYIHFEWFWGYVLNIPNPNQSYFDLIKFCVNWIHLFGISNTFCVILRLF